MQADSRPCGLICIGEPEGGILSGFESDEQNGSVYLGEETEARNAETFSRGLWFARVCNAQTDEGFLEEISISLRYEETARFSVPIQISQLVVDNGGRHPAFFWEPSPRA